MADEFKITAVRPFPAADLARSGKQDTAVLYEIRGGIQRIVIPKDYPAKEADILAAIREREKAIHPMMGKSYTL